MIRGTTHFGYAVAGGLVACLAVACSGGTKTRSAAPVTTTMTTAPASSTVPSSACTTGTTPAANSNKGPETNPPGDIPDNQAFVTFTPPAGGYSIKVPEGWARTDNAGGVSFTDKFNTVQV